MKSSKTAGGLALVGILCAGLMMMPGKGWATYCESYPSAAPADDIYEENDTYDAAKPLTSDMWLGNGGDPNCGVMKTEDEDWYKIDVSDGNTGIFIDLRFESDFGDMDLRLFDTNGTSILATASTNDQGDKEAIDYKTTLAAGTYYIKVNSGESQISNRYRLWTHVYMPAVQHTVTPSVSGGNGSVNPSGDTTVTHNQTLDLTLYPETGYTASRNVMGTCSYGNWTDGTHYTTGAITAPCTAIFSFGATKVVTSSAGTGGSVEPSGTQDVAENDTRSFTVTRDAGYAINSAVGGNCQGEWSDNVYTTEPITADCTVEFSFIGGATTYTVIPNAEPAAGGTIDPPSAVQVNEDATKKFIVTANTGYTTNAAVTGSCPTGTWNVDKTEYTTGAITATPGNCTVIFGFTKTYKVTPSAGAGGSFTPTGEQTVNEGATKTFTVTANAGYTTNSAVLGTCPAGTWNVGKTEYTTGAITATPGNCTVIFGFTSNGGSTNAPSLQGVYRMLL